MDSHCLLRGMNIGTLKKLRGKLLFVNVYVSDNEYKWTNLEVQNENDNILKSFDYIKQCVNKENVFFEYYVKSYYLNINYPFERASSNEWLKEFVNGFYCSSLKQLHDKINFTYC